MARTTYVNVPAMATSKRQRLNLRIADEDRALFDRAAFTDRFSVRIDSDQWDQLTAAMDRPAQARADLVRLFARARPE